MNTLRLRSLTSRDQSSSGTALRAMRALTCWWSCCTLRYFLLQLRSGCGLDAWRACIICRRRSHETASKASSNSTSAYSTGGTGASLAGVDAGGWRAALLARLLFALMRSCCAAWTSPLTSSMVDFFRRAQASSMRLRRSFLALAKARFCAFLDSTFWNRAGSCVWWK